MPLDLGNPAALLLLVALPAIYFLGRDRLALMAPWRGRAILGVRLASISAIVLALAGPSLPLRDATLSVAFVLDESNSISPTARAREQEWVRQALGRMKPADRAGVVTFAGDAGIVKTMSEDSNLQLPAETSRPDGTNISSAVGLASGLLPSSGLRKVVVVSDGWDTAGGVDASARSLPGGTRIDVVPLAAMEGQPEVLIESIDLPSFIREGDGFDVSAVVGSSQPGPAKLIMQVDGKETGNWDVQLGVGANLVTMAQKPQGIGFHSVVVKLAAEGDTVQENDQAAGFVVVKERGKVLLVEGKPNTSGALRQELEGSGLQVQQLVADQFPIQMPLLVKYDAVVLDNVSATRLSLDQLKTLQSFVRDQGHGLMVVGGQESYGLGDYSNGLLEEMLPVSSDPPITKDRGDMALVLVMDRSGSMDDSYQGVTKMAMARDAAIKAVQSLKPEDQIGVLAFDTQTQWVVPVQKVGADISSIQDRISRLQAGGGTDIYSALSAANMGMSRVQATTRHMTLLTDGQSWKGPYQLLLKKMNQDRITLSTIGIGDDADTPWLSELARLGNGRYYFSSHFDDIPNIVYREVTAATKVAQVDGHVAPVFTAPSPILRGVDGQSFPALTGYVGTKPKDAATTVLESERGDPLLAQWQYGLGRVVAWTSDADGLWSAAWQQQPGFSVIWDQSVRWAMAPPVDRALQVFATVEGGQATITVDSVDRDGQFIDLAETKAQVQDPGGNATSIQLKQTAPGRYQAAVAAPKPGVYRLAVSQSKNGQPGSSTLAGFVAPASPEYAGLGSNYAMLHSLASSTGGRVIQDPADAFSRDGMGSQPGWEPIWRHLLTLALLLLPVEIALRRIRSLPFSRDGEEDASADAGSATMVGARQAEPGQGEAQRMAS